MIIVVNQVNKNIVKLCDTLLPKLVSGKIILNYFNIFLCIDCKKKYKDIYMDNFRKWVSLVAAIVGLVIALNNDEYQFLWIVVILGISGFVYEQFIKKDNKTKKVLFIDDEYKDFPIIDSLKENNYDVGAVADITNIHDPEIKKAKIIFVDYKGVGTKFGKKQGVDLMKALKKKYPKKKFILFSSHKGFSMDYDFNEADKMINKNAPLDDFMSIIDKY